MSSNYVSATDYELLAQAVYQAILAREAIGDDVEVLHNQNVTGRSGAKHQIDVLWSFSIAGVKHTVMVECKNYTRSVEIGHVRNFYGAIHDIGNARGILVTKKGFQSGAKKYADHYGLDLKLLRPPTAEDWEGRVKDISLNVHLRWMKSTADSPVVVKTNIMPQDDAQRLRLEAHRNNLAPQGDSAALRLLDSSGTPISPEFREWLPSKVPVLEYEGVGPHQHTIPLGEAYLRISTPGGDELVRLQSLDVTFYTEELEQEEVLIHGDDIVLAILRDVNSGEIEHVHTAESP